MFKRLYIYQKEMYPIPARMLVGFLLFFEIYFLVLLTNKGIGSQFFLGIAEFVGAYTLFSFLFVLRIADDFKDYQTDLRIFPERPLASGRVKKKDLAVVLSFLILTVVPLNLIFLPNWPFFLLLVLYGLFMSFWFFQKAKIQNSLPLALITHNPIQIVMNLYVISFACMKYQIPLLTFNNLLIAITLYFPGLIWEISRKVRAPEEETEYVTYSKLFGYKRVTRFILLVMLFDLLTTSILVYQLYPWAVVTVFLCYIWLVWRTMAFLRSPSSMKLVKQVEIYEYLAEGSVVLIIVAALLGLGQ